MDKAPARPPHGATDAFADWRPSDFDPMADFDRMFRTLDDGRPSDFDTMADFDECFALLSSKVPILTNVSSVGAPRPDLGNLRSS